MCDGTTYPVTTTTSAATERPRRVAKWTAARDPLLPSKPAMKVGDMMLLL
jgi:hypothetical protein